MAKLAAIFVGAICGGATGVFYCILLGFLLEPTRDPRERAELGGPLAVATYSAFSCLGGATIGMILGGFTSRVVFICTAVGLIVGMLIGFVAWLNGLTLPADPRPSFGGGIPIFFTFVAGIAGSAVGCLFTPEQR